MADLKISQLTASTTPLAGTEVLPIVQSGATKQVSVANLTAGRTVSGTTFRSSDGTQSLPAYSFTSSTASGMFFGAGYTQISAENATYALFGSTTIYLQYPTIITGNTTLSTGNLVIGTAGKGIDFSADGQAAGMTSELLDDYEEGTWTPTKTTGDAFAFASGRYTKIGNQVTVTFIIQFAVEANGASAAMNGFPFSAGGASSESNGLAVGYQSASIQIGGSLAGATMSFRPIGTGSAGGVTITQMSNALVSGTMVYTI